MAGSLKDQLLKAGIVSKKQAKQVEQEQRRKHRQGQRASGDEERDRAAAIEAARLEKLEKDRQLNERRRQEQTQRALRAEIRQLAEQHRVAPPANADLRYHFVWQGKVRSLWVTEDLQQRLAAGTLAVIALYDGFVLVPAEVAERIAVRDPAVRVRSDDDEKRRITAEEAEYSDHPIPDDLHW